MKYVFHVNLQWKLEKKIALIYQIFRYLYRFKIATRLFGKITGQIQNFLVTHKLYPIKFLITIHFFILK